MVVSATLRHLLSAVEQESVRGELQEELEGASSIANSKNVVAGSISGAGMCISATIFTAITAIKKSPPPYQSQLRMGKKTIGYVAAAVILSLCLVSCAAVRSFARTALTNQT